MLPRHFSYFHCLNFKTTFVKKLYNFLTSSNFPQCRKALRSGISDYRILPFNYSQNLQKKKMSAWDM